MEYPSLDEISEERAPANPLLRNTFGHCAGDSRWIKQHFLTGNFML
jgi:hypothetical protein